ncbi:MAG TPA: PfkB family carbohydrate kinase [Thermoanaerobaculia bacterium]|nr:PfkB family carbohydrate kinase [Thermoanaerobaculia bacterium]
MSSPDNVRSRLVSLVDRFAGKRIAVAGDFVLDRFVHGLPKRISREAPVLILAWSREENVPGGGANTVANIAALSGDPAPAGAVGADPEGREIAALFERAGVDPSRLVEVEGYATPTKTRILGGGVHSIRQQVVRIDREDVLPEDPSLSAKLRENVRRAAADASILVLSDYGYGSSRPEWVAAARDVNPAIRVLVDSRFRLTEYAGADAATPNEEELERAAGETLGDSEERFERAGRALLGRLASPALLVTRGSRGMALFRRERPTLSIPVSGTSQVADVTGAGDTVMATFALALAAGANEAEAALLSNFAGGIVVMKTGTATLTPAELREAIERDRAVIPAVISSGGI